MCTASALGSDQSSNDQYKSVHRLINCQTRPLAVSYRLSEEVKMYCSSCGASVAPGLSYCNRCGAGLNAKDHGSQNLQGASHETLVWAMTSVTIVGIGAVIGLMAVMKEVVHFNNDLILGFSLLTFLAFLGVDSVIAWLLLRPGRERRKASVAAQENRLATNELEESKARLLPEPLFRVTDHTTHTLDPAEKQRERQ